MSSVSVTFLCGFALFVQSITAQCLPAPASYGYNTNNCGYGYDNIVAPGVAASNGGGFSVSVSSPLAPTGLFVQSDLNINGVLNAFGDLPLLAAVGVEGNLPTGGSASTTYSCGTGQVGISADSLAAAGLSASGYGAGNNAFGFGGYSGGIGAPSSRPCGCNY